MQSQEEIEKINRFLCMSLPIVTEIVKTILQSLNYQVIQKGHGLDLVFSIKAGKKEAEFYLHNLFLEIVTIDRDEEPLRFDENLRDFDYFLAKTARIIASKLNVLFHLFGEEDLDAAIENITKDAKQYERIRIWKVDQKGPT
ncbi:MAG: hypothetical protein NTX52_14320 [Planctomycetota bacterium]|nr:hypothetical protein [Planctomycetota bacterium]